MRPIDADALIEKIKKAEFRTSKSKSSQRAGNEVLHYVVPKIIASVPILEAAPTIHAKWILRMGVLGFTCSNCHKSFHPQRHLCSPHRGGYNYCPNCGAYMNGGEEVED